MQLKDGSWAVAYGLTIWASKAQSLRPRGESGIGEAFKSLWRWFKKFLRRSFFTYENRVI